MAEVYKVKTVGIAGFEKVQALKRIRPHYAREPRFIRSFVDEARIAVQLSHRNIVQVFDFGKAGGELYLAMELIDGLDLRSVTRNIRKRKVHLPIALACYILGEIGAGLDYAHRKTDNQGQPLGIVHCDVSPPNVMMSFEGQVKVLDFGVARAHFSAAQDTRRLRGKPRYMAPEQTRGDRPTPATDVFALGIIAWELLTGLPLFRGRDLHAILAAVRRADAPQVDRINPDVPAVVAETVARALEPSPVERGTSADFAVVMQRTAQLFTPRANARSLAEWLRAVYPERAGHDGPAPAIEARRDTETTSATRSLDNTGESIGNASTQPRASLEDLAEPTTPERERRPGDFPFRRPSADTPVSLPVIRHQVMSAPGPEPITVTLDTSSLDRDDRVAGPAVGAVASHDAPVDRAGNDAPVDHAGTDARAESEGPEDGAPPAEVSRLPTAPTLVHAVLDLVDSIDAASDVIRLGEKRRVVAVMVLLDGGSELIQQETIRLLGNLAYKRGAILHDEEPGGLVALFGLEVAGEDDVANAMGYALDAVQIGRDARRAPGGTGEIRLPGQAAGQTTGSIGSSARTIVDYAGTGHGELTLRIAARAGIVASLGERGGYRIIGDAIEETRQLARSAEPDRPLLSGSGGRLTSMYYSFRELPARRQRRRRLRVLELLGPKSFDQRVRALHARKGRFFGRKDEIARLGGILERTVSEDRRTMVALAGPPGVGKSRLIAEFVARSQGGKSSRGDLGLVAVAATPGGKGAPFSVVVELIQAALNLPPGRGEAARSRLTQRARHVLEARGVDGREADLVVGAVERAMELRDGAPFESLHGLSDPREAVTVAFHTLRQAIRTRERSIIVVVEDLHFADASSLDVLRRLSAVATKGVEGAEGAELMILTMVSDARGEVADWVDEIIDVSALPGKDLLPLVRDRLGESASDDAVATLAERTGGNPLLIEQLASEARDGGAIPPTARAMITARVDRLSLAAKAVLQHAAVAGSRFRPRLLEELFDREIASELDELCEEALVQRDDGSAGGSYEGELAFSGGLIRDVVYESLSVGARRDTHIRLGDLLSARFHAGRDEPPTVIAEHYERGGRLSRASAFWLRAGRLALAAGDLTAAVERFGRTLGSEEQRSDDDRSPASRARQREALAGREEAYRQLGDHDAQGRDLDRLERVARGDPGFMADVKNRAAIRFLRLGDYRAAIAAAEKAEESAQAAEALAPDSRNELLLGESLRIRGEAYERSSEFERSLEMTRRAHDIFERAGAMSEQTLAMIGIGRTYVVLNRLEDARAQYDAIIERVLSSGDTWLERMVRNHIAVIHVCLGQFEDAMTSIERAIAICRQFGDHAREGDCLAVSGTILMYVGCYDEARSRLGRALGILERTESKWSRADCLVYAGATEGFLGHHENALALLDESLRLSESIGAGYVQANALVTRTAVLLARHGARGDGDGADHEVDDRDGSLEAARSAAARAVAVAGESTLFGLEMQGLSRQALAVWRSGDLDQAIELSSRAIELLDRERYIEGPEEELLYTHYRLLRQRPDRAADAARILARARDSVEHKLAALTRPEWRQAFAGSVVINAAILDEPDAGE